MERLASRVARVLAADAPDAAPVVRAAMTYGEPSARQALAALKEAGCARVVAIPLYPQSASSTTAPALASVRAALKELTWDPELITVEHYGDEPRYLDAVAETMREAGFDASRDQVLFSLHSIPQGDIDAGDTYQAQVEESCAAIMERLGASHTRWQISFQSPFPDQRTWCGPFSGDVIVDLAREPRRTFVVCIGFAVDCLETLYDVEQKYRQRFAAEAVPGAELIYVPCLNDGDAHVELIAQLVRRAVDGRS